MSQTIKKSMGEGHGKGEVYAALAYDATDRFGGMKIKALMLNSTGRISFLDATSYIYSSVTTVLDIVSTTINITGSVVFSTNGNPSVSIGSSATPLTTATTGYSALKCWSDYTKADGYHVGAWFISNYNQATAGVGSVFALRGSAGVSATQTAASGAAQIIGVHGRLLSSGTIRNDSCMYAGVLGQVCIGGTWTAANFVSAGWFDWQLNTAVAAGNTQILYLSNNANNANYNPTNVMYVYSPYVTNFINFQNCGSAQVSFIGDTVTANPTIVTYKKIKVLIGSDTMYLLAVTI